MSRKFLVIEISIDPTNDDSTVSKRVAESAYLGGAYMEIYVICKTNYSNHNFSRNHSHYEIWETETDNNSGHKRTLVVEVFSGEIETMNIIHERTQ